MQSLNGVRYWEIIFFIHFSFKQSFANLQIDNAVNICNSESISSELFREHQMPARNKHVLRSFIYNNFLLLSQNHRVPSFSMTSIIDPVIFLESEDLDLKTFWKEIDIKGEVIIVPSVTSFLFRVWRHFYSDISRSVRHKKIRLFKGVTSLMYNLTSLFCTRLSRILKT